MHNIIGEIAGEIWNYFSLNGNKAVSTVMLAKKIERKKDEVLLASGWLAKEGKLNMESSGTTLKVSLN